MANLKHLTIEAPESLVDHWKNALRVVDISSGEPPTQKDKNPAAVALGKLGGVKGGPARAEELTLTERREIAQKAARARWDD